MASNNSLASNLGSAGFKALLFKGVKDDGVEPKALIVLNAQWAGGLGGDGVGLR
ncbi:hypothetical protein [Tahibacter aquaticus]|uniref:hypothetical protein n=1 Tax=Tahibacter aquaticus TaxID=520092 RepID=UPI0014152AB3|nr:hypothetical protein [Tahibacter aquaticus]